MNRDIQHVFSLDKDYKKFLIQIKTRLKITQLRTSRTINQHIVQFYWQLGSDILSIQSRKKHWGSKFMEQLAHDLQKSHTGLPGFSKRNLEYMRLLASLYPSFTEFAQQPAAQLPWSHIQLLFDKLEMQHNIENGMPHKLSHTDGQDQD